MVGESVVAAYIGLYHNSIYMSISYCVIVQGMISSDRKHNLRSGPFDKTE